MSTIFTKIIKGEIPCYKIAENEHFFAFLDVKPLVKGHTLVVPKQEIDYFFEMENQALSEIMVFSKTIAVAIKKAISCTKVGMSVIGLEVPHAHIHLVPIHHVGDLNFSKSKLEVDPEEMEAIAYSIRQALQA